MEDENNPSRPPIAPASYPFGHLFPGSGAGQSKEWAKRESDRRAGRNRKDWWKKAPDSAPSGALGKPQVELGHPDEPPE